MSTILYINHCEFFLHPLMRFAVLPVGVFVGQIVSRLDKGEKWRLRCSSKKVRDLILNYIPRPIHTDLDVYFVMLAFEHVDIQYDAPFVTNLMSVVREREVFNFATAFKRWVHGNRVCIDAGGFYVRLRGDSRIRIGWWEAGLVGRMAIGRDGKVHATHVPKNGLVVYDV